MSELKVGFIGAGGIAARHLGVLSGFDDVRVTALADVDADRALDLARPLGAQGYGDWRRMLDVEALDALWICVPPFAHGEPEHAAIARGLPFFVEKPLSQTLDVAEEIARAVEAAGLVTAVGYHWRYMETVDRARGVLAERPARLITGYWLDSTPPVGWWGRQAQSGGQMVEQTTHIFDLARWLVGEVEDVYAAGGRTPREAWPDVDIAETTTATVTFESGAVGALSSSCLLGWKHRVGLHLFGDDLAMEIDEGGVGIYGAPGTIEQRAGGDPVVAEDRDFLDAVRGAEDRIRSPYAEALRTHRVTMAANRSLETGRPVRLKEFA